MGRRFELTEFRNQVAASIEEKDELILLSSGIWSFGSKINLSLDILVESLFESIISILRPHQTLLLPAFTYSFCKNRFYNPRITPPETGVVSLHAMNDKRGIRTKSAINSYFAFGSAASLLGETIGESVWGKGSIAEKLEETDAKILSLGLPISLSTGFMHRIEELEQVPYRYYKNFEGTWEQDGTRQSWEERMFVRSQIVPAELDWSKLEDILKSESLLFSTAEPFIFQSTTARKIIKAGRKMLSSDPLALVQNYAAVSEWIINSREFEIQDLNKAE